MKINKLTAGLFVVSMFALASSNAAIVTVASGFDKAVTDSTGVPIADGGGFVAVGFFSTISDDMLASSSSTQLASDFQQFGASSPVGLSGLGGFYEFNASGGRVGAASSFLGQNAYTIVGNGADIASSTQFVIYKHEDVFTDDSAAAIDVQFRSELGETGGTYLFGGPNGTITIGEFEFAAVNMAVAVPEASSVLFGALGALGLLRRRR